MQYSGWRIVSAHTNSNKSGFHPGFSKPGGAFAVERMHAGRTRQSSKPGGRLATRGRLALGWNRVVKTPPPPLEPREAAMKRVVIPALIALLFSAVLLIPAPAPAAPAATVSVQNLKQMMATSEVVVIDVRLAKHYDPSNKIIAGAKRELPGQADKWAKKYDRAKIFVLY
jgi:hypothetical protein